MALAGAGLYLLVVGALLRAFLLGVGPKSLRGGSEFLIAALCGLCLVSYSLPAPGGPRLFQKLIRAAAGFFAVGLALLGTADLVRTGGPVPIGTTFVVIAYVLMAAALGAYLQDQLPPERGAAYLVDVAIVVVSVVALVGPLVMGPLATVAGARGVVAGAVWTAEMALFSAAIWAVAAWISARRQLDFTVLLWVLAGGLALGSAHLILVLGGNPSMSWWLAALYGPPVLVLMYVPQLGGVSLGGADAFSTGWSRWQAYLPYGPAAVLLGVGLVIALAGWTATAARFTMAGALLVSALVMARQSVLLRDHRGLLGQRSAEALRDPLTTLLNRRAFDGDLALHCSRADRDGQSFVLLLVDLDGLKAINDGPGGHRAGDRALRAVAGALATAVRAADRAYRLGGDEFAVLVEAGDRSLGRALVERARETLALTAPGVAFSASVALGPDDGTHPALLFAAADRWLYEVKRARSVPTLSAAGTAVWQPQDIG